MKTKNHQKISLRPAPFKIVGYVFKGIIYATKKLALQAKENHEHRKNVHFNKSFAKAGFLESAVNLAKQAIKTAKGHILSTLEHFALHVNLMRAYKHLNSFKYSLPRNIRINLF